jgi:competence ComEA-like helix-hairpin-helix protein
MILCAGATVLWGLARASDDADGKRLPDGPGKDLTAKLCIGCHDSGNFRKRRLTSDEWAEKIADMVDRGAKGTESELAAVGEYLTQNFGPDSKIRVNTAPMIELKTVLGITAQQAQALVDYREARGNFKEWRELQKVAGEDGGKIEGKKDLMLF